jgi:hypothetical protein
MQVIKFVTEDFKSPGRYRQLDYSKFGISIEVAAEPKESGQCGRGIHVVPISEDADLTNVIFTETMILLEVGIEDIVYCEGNGKMRVRKATPIRQVTKSDEEWWIIRTAACNDPLFAYMYAREVDKKPTDETRTAACQDSRYTYCYARDIDKKPTDETRTAACKDPEFAYMYARDIDKKPTDETRTAACKEPIYAYLYAKYVDNGPTDETRIGACQHPEWAYNYAIEVDKKPTEATRTAACQNPSYAYKYARDIDQTPTEETRIGASKWPYCKEQYEYWENGLNS